jgi:ADP-ribose pyrophosphatase YjhB (NUDIX family)
MPLNILALLDEIRTIGQLGLNFSDNPYDRERYERLLHLAAGEYAVISGLPESDLQAFFRRELGYITPKVGCSAAVFNDEGHVLLVKRSDNGKWCLPGGYAEVNHTPQDNVRREVWEETGIEVTVGALIDVYHALPGQYGQPHTLYSLLYECNMVGGTLTPSHETPIVGFYDHTTITEWHSTHHERVIRAYLRWLEKKQE